MVKRVRLGLGMNDLLSEGGRLIKTGEKGVFAVGLRNKISNGEVKRVIERGERL
jgi:hypothetical protein